MPESSSKFLIDMTSLPLHPSPPAAQIHGYAYEFLYAKKGEDRYNTWTKPRVLQEMLRNHKFVVFVGGDATIGRPEVPIEFWLNRWNVTPSTPIAMPADRQQAFDDWVNDGRPSIKGKVELHTGVVIFQNIPATHEMMDAWEECTIGIRGGQWKERWTREQRAFTEYLRSDFNPQLDNILVRIHPSIIPWLLPLLPFPFPKSLVERKKKANHNMDGNNNNSNYRAPMSTGSRNSRARGSTSRTPAGASSSATTRVTVRG